MTSRDVERHLFNVNDISKPSTIWCIKIILYCTFS